MKVLRTFRGTYWSNLLNQLRFYTLTGWMAATVLGALFLLFTAAIIARFLTAGGEDPGALGQFTELTGYPSYLSFAVLGLAFNGLALSALDDGGSAVYDEESEGTWDLVALTPMNRFVWMFAKNLAGMTASFIDFLIVIAVGALAFGLVVTPSGLVAASVGVALTVLALQGFGFLMAALGLLWKQPHALAVLLSPVLILISGMMFPVEALPEWVQIVSYSFPLTYGIEIVRDAILLGQGVGDLTREFTGLLATGLAFGIVGFTAFKIMERRALKLGVMGRY